MAANWLQGAEVLRVLWAFAFVMILTEGLTSWFTGLFGRYTDVR
jgi:hypothetical protein